MGSADYYKHGDWNVICDRCFFKKKASECKKDGYNPSLFVCKICYDPPHPLDKINIKEDKQQVPTVRPDSNKFEDN